MSRPSRELPIQSAGMRLVQVLHELSVETQAGILGGNTSLSSW